MSSTPFPYDLTKEEDIKEYLNNIEIEYSFHCFSEKSPEGCHRLATFYDQIQIDRPKAMKLFRMNCDKYKYGHSCNKLAKSMMIGKDIKGSNEEIFHYHQQACDYGFTESCYSYALMHMDKQYVGENKNINKCLEYLKKGCAMKNIDSCSKLGEVYRKGVPNFVEKDPLKSVEYHKQGCDLESLQSCVNLHVMFKNGDGVDKNENLANKYKSLAELVKERYYSAPPKMDYANA